MRIIRDFESCSDAYKGAVIALGNFDGVHRGHQAVIRTCLEKAKEINTMATVMTFEPHPRQFFKKNLSRLSLYPFRDKALSLKSCGISALFAARFNAALAETSAESFVRDILVNRLRVRHVTTGYNFAFGKGRSGNAERLAELSQRYGFGYTSVSSVSDEEHAISSSAIRSALDAGDLSLAARMLGRPYVISGHVIRGDARGRDLGFPTANLSMRHLFCPRFGVYAARISFENDERYHAAVNIGIRPMFTPEKLLLEAHCFGMHRSCYGERMHVELVSFLREEQRFDSLTALQNQMATDCARAQFILEEYQDA